MPDKPFDLRERIPNLKAAALPNASVEYDPKWRARLADALCIGALAMFVGPAASSAQAIVDQQDVTQVTFEQVEAALVALEASVGATLPQDASLIGQDAPEARAEVALPPVGTPPPTIPDPNQISRGDGSAEIFGGVQFLPLLEGQGCPQSPPDITAGAKLLADELRRTEADMSDLERAFAALEDQNAVLESNRDLATCPGDFVKDVEALLGELADFNLLAEIQAAESFSACSQARVQALNDRMAALQASTDPNSGAERLAVGQLMSRMAMVDGEVSRSVGTLVFFDQRRGRLESAAGAILQRCNILSGYE